MRYWLAAMLALLLEAGVGGAQPRLVRVFAFLRGSMPRSNVARVRALFLGPLLVLMASGELEAHSLVPRVSNWETYFRVDWQAHERDGRTVLSGYVISVNKYGARWMQLLIDSRDAGGALIDQKLVWIPSEFPQGGRAYFEVTVAPAAAFRVSVFAYEPPPRP